MLVSLQSVLQSLRRSYRVKNGLEFRERFKMELSYAKNVTDYVLLEGGEISFNVQIVISLSRGNQIQITSKQRWTDRPC